LIEQYNGDIQSIKNVFVFSLQSFSTGKEKDEDVRDGQQRRTWEFREN
jgi:hypothetical protein